MRVFELVKNKLFSNSIWLVLEKTLSIFGVIFITSLVAKYIGPTNLGKLAFIASIFILVQTIATFGTDVIGLKRLSQKPNSGIRLLFSIVILRNLAYCLISIPILIYGFYFFDRLTFIFSIATTISTFIVLQDIYLIYNNATLKAKYNVFANMIGLIIALILRFLIPYFELNPAFLSVSIVANSLVPFFIRKYIFKKSINRQLYSNIKFGHKIRYSKYIILTGTSLVVSSVAVTLYINISQLMLGVFDTKKNLGIYAVALTLGSMWAFINQAVLITLTPKLYQSKDINEVFINTSLISRLIIVFGFFYFFIFLFTGQYIIDWLYGKDYSQAYSISLFIIIATTLGNLGQVYSRFIIFQNGYIFLMYKQVVVLFFSLSAGLLFISLYGVYGAGYTVLLTEFFSLTVSNYFFNKYKVLQAQLYIFKCVN